MDRQGILKTLKQLLEEDRGESYDSMDESATLREDLGLDSVDMITLVMQIQDQFRVVLASDELEKIVTVKDLLDLMEAKVAAKSDAA